MKSTKKPIYRNKSTAKAINWFILHSFLKKKRKKFIVAIFSFNGRNLLFRWVTVIKVINELRAYYFARFTPLLYYSLEKLFHYFWWLGMTFVYNSLLFYTTFAGLCSALAGYVVLKRHEINQNVFYLLHRRGQKMLAVCFLKIESIYRQLGNFFCWNVHTSFYPPLYIKISFALIIRDNLSSTF